jgi:hypothetical protein
LSPSLPPQPFFPPLEVAGAIAPIGIAVAYRAAAATIAPMRRCDPRPFAD